jgi:hypothetical protein
MGYSATNPTFEGTYIPAIKDATKHAPILVGNNKASLPPKYLSVPDFQKCLSQKNMGTWKSWCLPENKLKGCPSSSWDKLKFNNHSLHYCTQKAEIASHVRAFNIWAPSKIWLSQIGSIISNKTTGSYFYDAAQYELEKNCNLQGDIRSDNYQMSYLGKPECSLAAMKLIAMHTQANKKEHGMLTVKASQVYIDGHKLSNIKYTNSH